MMVSPSERISEIITQFVRIKGIITQLVFLFANTFKIDQLLFWSVLYGGML